VVETQPPPRAAARMAVVTLPAEIDVTNAHRVREDLQATFASGVTTIVADMTGTTFCDSPGIRALVLAAKRGAAGDAELRVVPSAPVSQVLSVLGLDGWLTIYPSLDEALAGKPVLRPDAAHG
jgi:anti-sigma B factor antagonist